MSDEAVEAGAVGDFLQILEEHMKNCERAGKYIEADLAKKRLEECAATPFVHAQARPATRAVADAGRQ